MKITKQSKELYQQASDKLSLINQTWQKAENDTASFMICHSVKECMNDMLNCYLLMKKGKPASSKNLGDLVTQCAALDERFKQIDLRWLNCKEHDLETAGDVFCTSIQRIQICTWIANGIKKVVDDEMKILNVKS